MADLAMVCGATGGLGTALVAHFTRRGDEIVTVGRDEGALGDLASRFPGVVATETADLTRPDEVEALWARLDDAGRRPRWLVNAVGGYRAGTVESISPEDQGLTMDLNLGSAWWSCRSAVPRMKTTGGCIVNVSSRTAFLAGAESAAYTVAKTGVLRLTEVLAAELLEDALRVNCVVPAMIDTPENRVSMGEEATAKAVPASAIADVIGFLCSPAADAITGAAIPVYGRFPKPWISSARPGG